MDILGRDDELRSLQAFLDRPAAAGLAAFVLEGDAGIGKTTLWLAGLEAARERGLRVLFARPTEGELGVAHAGLGDLLEDALGDVLPELASPRRRALEIALLVRDETDGPVDFRTLAVAVRSALQVLAEREPILVAIDDVQWLDPSSTRAFAFALRRLQDESIRLLLARRLGQGIPVSALELAVAKRSVERLGPLSSGALHGVLQRRLGRVFSRPTLLRLYESSDGNPFYALELARALGPVADPTQPLRVPQTLEALVRARLDGLPEKTREALLLACAHGRLSAALVDDDALQPAFADDLIEVTDGFIRFTHPLLASVLYQGASPGATRRAHKRLAEFVDDPLSRARHVALASEGPDAEIAATLEQGAALAGAQGAPIVAAELGEHALRLTPSDLPEVRQRRTITTARAHMAAGDLSRAAALGHDLLARSPPGRRRAEALLLLSDVDVGLDSMGLRQDALREASAVPALQAEIHALLSWETRFTEGLRVADAHARASLELAETLHDDVLVAGGLVALATSHFYLGEPDALELTEEALRVSGECDPEGSPRVQLRAASIFLSSGRLDRSRSMLEQLRREWGGRDEEVEGLIHWLLGLVELSAGHFALAADEADLAREIHLQYEGEETAPSLWEVALVTAHRGDLELAHELAVRGLESTPDLWFAAYLEGALGVVAAWSGDTAGALERFGAADDLSNRLGLLEPGVLRWRPEQVEALLELGRVDEAALILDIWAADGARLGRERVLATAARCRGLVAAARGGVGEALDQLEEAVVQHEEVGDPFGRARALLALGGVRRRARQKRPARDAIEAALAGFEECGARGWAEAARAELGQIGGRTRQEGLTRAEQRVAALVAEGRTNREVAAALFLAEATVASHLSHVYVKLGVRSRTELARKHHRF